MTKTKREDPELSRRRFIQGALGATAGIGALSFVSVLGGVKPANVITPNKEPPAKGDLFVYAAGNKAGQPVPLSDVNDKGIIQAWPKGKVVKDGLNLNMVILARFKHYGPPTVMADLSQEVVCYSAVCTHLCCLPSWNASDPGTLLCPCHGSRYNLRDGAKVFAGPAPRPLPQMPIKVKNGQIYCDGPFNAPPGCSIT